jgi:3-phenylpropionate/trans-cinnamate dioxygenase ferredoxin reductase subunit
MNVNVWDVTDPIDVLMCTRPPVESERLAEPAVPLAELPERSPA